MHAALSLCHKNTVCVEAHRCYMCAERSYVEITHVPCSVACLLHTLVLIAAMLHVPRHGDATRVQYVTCFPKSRLPQVPFSVPGAPPCCICLCRSHRDAQTYPILALCPGTVGWGLSPHSSGGTQRDVHGSGPLVRRFVAWACCHQEGGPTGDTPQQPKQVG